VKLKLTRSTAITVSALSAGAVAAGVLVAHQAVTRSTIEAVAPAAGASVSTARPLIGVTVGDFSKTRDLVVRLDGTDVTERARVDGDTVKVRAGALRDGPHEVEVSYRTSNLLARSVTRRWRFETDTSAPGVAVVGPPAGAYRDSRSVAFSGTAEPGSSVALTWRAEGTTKTVANGAGRWTARLTLPEGAQAVKVTATDRAGNERTRTRRLVVDTRPPRLRVAALPRRLGDDGTLLVTGSVPGENPRALTFGVNFNGQKRVIEKGADAPRTDEFGATFRLVSLADEEPALTLDGRSFALATGALPQGKNRITVWARDRAGNLAKRDFTVTVDSTESFGGAEMVRGATGEDVRKLHRRLKANKVYRGPGGATFTRKTERAVKAYQRKRKLDPTGRVDQATLTAMIGRIVVNLEQRKLRLIQDGRVAKTYEVAIGTAAHPTPTGKYEVIDKQVDPAWFPPDSPWAAGLGVIPPGPGNPLGTRWIGTSAPAIGIHGTYASSSIGTAASHGCIRMHIGEVEELFEEVALGTSVEFRSS
jgi:lipoprotein-anchoring transpeptidase ErfK/SrfK